MTIAALATLPPSPPSLAQAFELRQLALLQAYGGLAVATAEDLQQAPACAALRPHTCPQLRRSKLRKRILLMETLPQLRPAPCCHSTTSTCRRSWAIRSLHCRTCPFLRAAVRGALVHALERLRAERAAGAATGTGSSRALGALHTGPRMLLARTATRATAFQRGEWLPLLQSTRRMRTPARDCLAQPPDEPSMHSSSTG